MSKLPVAKPREVIKKLQKAGFVIDHVSGSHYVLYNEDKTFLVTVPYHTKPLKRKTFASILKQANLSVGDYIKLR